MYFLRANDPCLRIRHRRPLDQLLLTPWGLSCRQEDKAPITAEDPGMNIHIHEEGQPPDSGPGRMSEFSGGGVHHSCYLQLQVQVQFHGSQDLSLHPCSTPLCFGLPDNQCPCQGSKYGYLRNAHSTAQGPLAELCLTHEQVTMWFRAANRYAFHKRLQFPEPQFPQRQD